MGNFYEDIKKYRKEITFAATAVILFILIKYVVLHVLPFIFAALFVALFRKPINLMHAKTKIGRGFLAGAILFCFILFIGVGVWYGSIWGIAKIKQIIVHLSVYENQFARLVHQCCNAVENNLGINSFTVENMILERADTFMDDLKGDVVPKVLGQTMLYGRVLFQAVMFLIVTFIAVVLLAKDYPFLLEKAENIRLWRECIALSEKLFRLIGAYIRAQMEIILIVSMICFLGFCLSGYRYPYVWGIVTGILDVLPFVGTGIVLLPLAVVELFMGNTWHTVLLVVTFIVSALARELLEPKLIGARMGVVPIAVLAAVYVGARVFGATGVIWGPLYMLTLYEIYKKLYQY